MESIVFPSVTALLKTHKIQIYQLHPIRDPHKDPSDKIPAYKMKHGIVYYGYIIDRESITDDCNWLFQTTPCYIYRIRGTRKVKVWIVDEFNASYESDLIDLLDDGLWVDESFAIMAI